MDDDIKIKNIFTVICMIALLLAIPSIWPYGYYQLLRWVVSGTALFVLWAAYNLEKKIWVGLMAVIVILFNPIAPIYLDKETWVIIDFVVAALFLISIFKIKNYEEKQ